MLRGLIANGVGLQESYELTFAERINLFAGDNGLGKSFLLDLTWWALTGSWFSVPALPNPKYLGDARLIVDIQRSSTEPETFSSLFEQETQMWTGRPSHMFATGIVIYAGGDGRFSVWDYLRAVIARKERNNQPFYGSKKAPLKIDPVYSFDSKSLLEGLRDPESGRVRCNGLINDLVDWQLRLPDEVISGSDLLEEVLGVLSYDGEKMRLGTPTKPFIDDVREVPTIRFAYDDVPLMLCSSGVQRVLSLAYLLVWAWKEHLRTSALLKMEPRNHLTLIIDELELHLHPKWQRQILPAILRVAELLDPRFKTQLFVTTHSPLVMTSIESIVDAEIDILFHFKEDSGNVSLETLPWIKEGDADSYLTSEVFGLPSVRSKEAQRAMEQAEQFLEGNSTVSLEEIERQLSAYLPGIDPFLVRWNLFTKKND